ncbi:hypothetical protein [Pseudalkalibacillus sp. NRS-1564]|uniref:hypothetical protein n=1 Tax=Pseudalkalibacillus sp. NRS-1564 TaxID=3233900 RepID=UPI003D2CFB93
MNKPKFHPFTLINLFISAVAMGMFAYDMYSESKLAYTLTFVILCLFFTSSAIYGIIRNQKLDRAN